MVRRAESERRQAINRHNAAARRHNAGVNRAIDEHNRGVRQYRREVDTYNRKVRTHNSQVLANRRKMSSEIERLNSSTVVTTYVETRQSSLYLHSAYEHLESAAANGIWGPDGETLLAYAGAEAGNSAAAANALLGQPIDDDERGTRETAITDELIVISEDLDKRWRGALYALDPRNPDAARHFCTSSREILARMLELHAPDEEVAAANPECQMTSDGRPIRREKLNYLLTRRGLNHPSLEGFVEIDIDDVVALFRTFNDKTHGSAGGFPHDALLALKRRVEGAISFTSALVRPE